MSKQSFLRLQKGNICQLINNVLSAVIFGEGTSGKLIFPSTWRRPLREISESIIDCMSVVRKKPLLFKCLTPAGCNYKLSHLFML